MKTTIQNGYILLTCEKCGGVRSVLITSTTNKDLKEVKKSFEREHRSCGK
jgi:translation initiation factor 2 beta subunit (eIF-2beta)/eIF-5